MRMRTGLLAGAALGYYLGAKAGRQRYEQMSTVLGRAARSGAVRSATSKVWAAADLGKERIKDLFGVDAADEPGTRAAPSTREPRARLPKAAGGGTNGSVVPLTGADRRYW